MSVANIQNYVNLTDKSNIYKRCHFVTSCLQNGKQAAK